jgi:MvaI/BcnI restriction endonuclease family
MTFCGVLGKSVNDFQSLAELKSVMLRVGVRRLYVKTLAANDNSKNQVYLAGGFSVLNQIPTETPDPQEGSKTLWGRMLFSWLCPDGTAFEAKGSKLILYPQYPEVRFSGFLQGCAKAPNDLFNSAKLGRTPGRVLFLGVADGDRIFGYAAAADTKLAFEIASLKPADDKTTLLQLALSEERDSRTILLGELTRIHRLDWIKSQGLRADGSIQPCTSPNCVGYTLEAELGVARNGRSEPDYLGWEIKASQVHDYLRPPTAKAQTLFTPEPNGGYYKRSGAEAFVRKFGYPDRQGRDDRLNFGGVFRNGLRADLTGLTLALDGYDADHGKITSPSGAIVLLDDKQEIAASWSFPSLLALWSRKHAKAAYIPAEKSGSDWRYRYGPNIRLATGTDFLLLLKAVQAGTVYYDPGIKVEGASTNSPKLKRRSQFRIGSNGLDALYHSLEEVSLTA